MQPGVKGYSCWTGEGTAEGFTNHYSTKTGLFASFSLAFGLTYVLLRLIHRAFPLRVTPAQEALGLNAAEHGAPTHLQNLLAEMEHQRQTGDFLKKVTEPEGDVGRIAAQYNRVLDKVNLETSKAIIIKEVADMFRQFYTIATDPAAWPADEAEAQLARMQEKIGELQSRMQELKAGIRRWEEYTAEKGKEIGRLRGSYRKAHRREQRAQAPGQPSASTEDPLPEPTS